MDMKVEKETVVWEAVDIMLLGYWASVEKTKV
jgi:hypothetical protein